MAPSLHSALHDPERLEALRWTGLLDAPPEPALERLTRLAARLLDAPTAVVTLVDAHRQFFTSCLGLPDPWRSARETPLTHSFCRHVVEAVAPLVVADAREHPVVRENLAIRDLGVIAYLGVPLTSSDGAALGALAVIDGRPRDWSDADRATLEDLAASVMTEMALRAEVRHGHEVSERLRESQARLEEAQRLAGLGSWSVEFPAGDVRWSAELYRLFGRDPAADVGGVMPQDAFFTTIHAEDRERVRAEIEAARSERRPFEVEHRVPQPDGTERVLRGRGEPVFGPDGTLQRMVGTAQDVTEAARATTALRASEQRFRTLVESAHEGVWVVDTAAETIFVNPRLVSMLGYPAEAMRGRPMFDFMDPAEALAARRLFARRQQGIAETHDFAFRRADGTTFLTTVSASPLWEADGAFAGALALVTDVTEQRRAEAALRDSEAGLRLALRAAGMIVWERDLATERLRNLATLPNEVVPHVRAEGFGTYAVFLDAVHPEDRERVARAHAEAVARFGEFSHQFRLTTQQGHLRWMHSTGRVLPGEDGRPARMIGVSLDVTERVALEAQLRQAQKMEAVGQLAGGVAHDFNNLLTVITAATRFAREALPPDTPAGEDLASVDAAAERAAQLTRQLLAFSRQQLLKPVRLDVGGVVHGVERMLRRLLGEDIEILTSVAPALPPVLADPGQLEQVLLNLAVNARDAMPNGGRLVLQTVPVVVTAEDAARRGVEVAPGPYVRISVRDTGTGMDEATLAQLFEPFFTTKAPGKGTGLGLATVYGIVKQSGGYAWVTSAPGVGTTFEVDLPAAAATDAGAAVASGARPADAGRGTETVLLVEDDTAVRAVTRRLLVRQGYVVVEAPHGAAALELLERHAGPVDLVVTDVVMPEMSGQEFAAELARRRPGLRVLFMSGYTDDEVLRRGVLSPGTAFLEKPFTHETLLQAVRSALTSDDLG